MLAICGSPAAYVISAWRGRMDLVTPTPVTTRFADFGIPCCIFTWSYRVWLCVETALVCFGGHWNQFMCARAGFVPDRNIALVYRPSLVMYRFTPHCHAGAMDLLAQHVYAAQKGGHGNTQGCPLTIRTWVSLNRSEWKKKSQHQQRRWLMSKRRDYSLFFPCFFASAHLFLAAAAIAALPAALIFLLPLRAGFSSAAGAASPFCLAHRAF